MSRKTPDRVGVVQERKVAGDGDYLDFRPESERPCPQAAVHLGGGIVHDLHGATAHPALVAHLGRDGVGGLAAVGDDSVNAHDVRVLKRLPLGVESMEGDQRCLEGVDSAMGRASRVGGFAQEPDVLAHVRVRRAA